mgnify:CR=1 FL=1
MNHTTILLVGHGSREDTGNQEIRVFVDQWRARQPAWRIEVCFIEFAAPSLHDGLLAAARSSRRVLVLPLILNAAGHAKMEIPEAIEHAREHGAMDHDEAVALLRQWWAAHPRTLTWCARCGTASSRTTA